MNTLSKLFYIMFLPIIASCMVSASGKMRSDKELIEAFLKNRTIFEHFLDFFENSIDKEIDVGDDPDLTILLNKISVIKITNKALNVEHPDVQFSVFSGGFAGGGSGKGYIYIKNPKNRDFVDRYKIVKSLDEVEINNHEDCYVYRKIDGYWYIYYWYDG
jgi:hypothetical protein